MFQQLILAKPLTLHNMIPDEEKIKEASKLRGLGYPLLFAMDGVSVPGKSICHFIRLETIEFNEGDEPNMARNLATVDDPRVTILASTFTAPAGESLILALQALSANMAVVDSLLKSMGPFIPASAQQIMAKALVQGQNVISSHVKP